MNKPFVLSTDASGSALGYILGQIDETGKEQAIAFGGRALHPDEKKMVCRRTGVFSSNIWDGNIQTLLKKTIDSRSILTIRLFNGFRTLKIPLVDLADGFKECKNLISKLSIDRDEKNQNADAISRIPYPDVQNDSTASTSVAVVGPADNNDRTESDTVSRDAHNHEVEEGEYLQLHLEYAEAPLLAPIDPNMQYPNPEIIHLQQECDDFKDIYRYLSDQVLPEN